MLSGTIELARMTTQPSGGTTRRRVEVEKLVQWAYRDELPKRHTSSAEGSWDRLAQFGSLGGMDPGHGAAQRYPHFGLPHPDAEAIEKAVGALPDLVIDWPESTEAILGDLASLVAINQLQRPQGAPGRLTTSGWTDHKTGRWRVAENRPRDVLLLGKLNTAALVTMHAAQGTRPDWADEHPQPTYIQADRSPTGTPALIGECRGRDLYATGSYCPVCWEPSPVSIAQLRADYWCWFRGLEMLAESLELAAHVVLPPSAPPQPWLDSATEPGLIFAVGESTGKPLPLKPQRKLATGAKRPQRGSAVRKISID